MTHVPGARPRGRGTWGPHGRCLARGNCFSCDNCFGVCPDNAVLELGKPGERYAIDLEICPECPCGAIEMVPEEI